MGPCVITARILRSTWKDALGLGAGAVIIVLRGRCAERRPIVATSATGAPRIDLGGLTGTVYHELTGRLASAINLVFEWCDEDGVELNDVQKVQILRAMFASFEGIEAKIAVEIRDDLDRLGIEWWGLSDDLQRMVGHAS